MNLKRKAKRIESSVRNENLEVIGAGSELAYTDPTSCLGAVAWFGQLILVM